MKKYTHKAMDNERALYMESDIELVDCSFTGQEDGESALKECQNVVVRGSTLIVDFLARHSKKY